MVSGKNVNTQFTAPPTHVCRKLASEGQATVFATDSILTTIMCMRSSRYSWDLLVSKNNGKVGLSKLLNGLTSSNSWSLTAALLSATSPGLSNPANVLYSLLCEPRRTGARSRGIMVERLSFASASMPTSGEHLFC